MSVPPEGCGAATLTQSWFRFIPSIGLNTWQPSRDEKKRIDAELRKKQKAGQARKAEVERLEGRIAETESAIRELEARMSAPGFYDDRAAAQTAADDHQALMWKVNELMQRWEDLQSDPDLAAAAD